MPWKECSVMDERLRFVARLLDGEAMSEVCRAFGISRKTGYKIFERYKEHGLEALTDRSRRPVRYANQLPRQIESLIVVAKRDKPHWGARKIRELLVRRLDGDIRVPAKSTIHAVLHRHGLVKVPGRPRHRATGTPLSTGAWPPAAERPPRAHASHAEERSNPTARNEQPAATGPVRRLCPGIQHRTATRGARHEVSG
jgi:transposase